MDPETVKSAEPPIGNTVKTKLRLWQILPALVEANPHWLATQRIVTNGVAWGDEADPVLLNPKKRKAPKVSVIPQARPKRPKAATSTSEVAEVEGRLSELMGGESEDAMFACSSSP